jgi:biopolymer transport protein ExbD
MTRFIGYRRRMRIIHRMLWLAGALLVTPAVADPVQSGARTDGTASILAAQVTPQGVWLGLGPRIRCFIARKDGALDAGALETELRRLRGDDRSAIEISAIRGVPYQDLVGVMDISIKVGLIDAGVAPAKDLGTTFDHRAAARRSAPARCAAPPAPRPVPAAPPAPAPKEPALQQLTRPPSPDELERRRQIFERPITLPPPSKPDLSKVPVVIVTKTEITVAGRALAAVPDVARGSGVIQPLLDALDEAARGGNASDGPVIVQADGEVDAVVILRIAVTATRAGYDNVLFAVKNRRAP